jgi:hypothetical protein
MTPFRCISANGAGIKADVNHPLTGKPLQLKAIIKDVREKFEEHGGTSNDWVETALSGPGMQARVNGSPTNFFADHPFEREDESEDSRSMDNPEWSTTSIAPLLILFADFTVNASRPRAMFWI